MTNSREAWTCISTDSSGNRVLMDYLSCNVVCHVLVEHEGKCLLIFRNGTDTDDLLYAFPAGHVDDGEAFKHAACRELKEEVNLDVKEEDLDFLTAVRRADGSAVHFIFKAKKWSGEIHNNEPDKCSEIKWVDYKEIPENSTVYTDIFRDYPNIKSFYELP